MDTCVNCGTPLGDGQAFCPKCGTPKGVVKQNFCSKCGTEIKEGQEFCSQCGQKVDLQIDANVNSAIMQFNASIEKTSAKSKDGILYTIFALLAGVLLFVDGFFQYKLYTKIYTTSTKIYDRSYQELMNSLGKSTGNAAVAIPIVICVILLLILIFSWLKDKHSKLNVVNIILSSVSLVILLISSIGGAVTYGMYYSDYLSSVGYVTFNFSFHSFGVLFYAEIILLTALLVLSIVNKTGKTIIKSKKN